MKFGAQRSRINGLSQETVVSDQWLVVSAMAASIDGQRLKLR